MRFSLPGSPWTWLTAGVAALCLGMLGTWVPHYLTWPWWPDHDTIAAMALGWSVGVLPYQDVEAYTFPGPIYLLFLLQSGTGPGTTVPLYAFDAALVAAMVGLLIAWSQRRFGRVLPGLLGSAAFLAYYLNLNFSLVAQRDWHAIFFVVVGLLLPAVWPGRGGRVCSALALALALSFRPQAVLFIPALALAVVEGARYAGGGTSRRRVLTEWSVALGVFGLLLMAPLLAAGIGGDFVQGLRLVSYGGPYSRATPLGMVAGIARPLIEPRFLVVPVGLAVLLVHGGSGPRREAIVWGAAWLGVLLYKPLHPFPHDYLELPRWLIWAVGVSVLAEAALSTPRWPERGRLLAVLLLLALAVPGKPAFCNAVASLRVLTGTPTNAPPGYVHHMTEYQHYLYPWKDYQATLDYLQTQTLPETRVANALRYQVAFNGASGRLSVFPNESGLLWLTQVNRDEDWFIEALRQTPDSVVVWSPGEEGPDPDFRFPRLEAEIRRLYVPDARFGVIEVWSRRKAERVSSVPSAECSLR